MPAAGNKETTTTVRALNASDRKQYETMFADVLISHKLLEIGESIGQGRLTTTHSCVMLPKIYLLKIFLPLTINWVEYTSILRD